jgi:PAS domain S-box-containing protein
MPRHSDLPAESHRTSSLEDTSRLIGTGVAVAIAYVVAAQVGFRFAFVAEQVTTVWAPTGIALAALLLWGQALWPAVWIGAFIANAASDAPLWVAGAVATGNTLEAVLAAWVLRRGAHLDLRLQRVRDVSAFVVIAAAAATAVSATIGVTTLCAAGLQAWANFTQLWRDWWLGDAIGAIVVAPVLLTLARRGSWSRRQSVEGLLLVSGAMIALHVVFGAALGPTAAHHPLEYVIFPFVIAAAVRSGQPVTSLVVLGATGVTIWHTVRGVGPFAGTQVHESLILLQAFMGVLAGTGLLLAAAIAERKTGEGRRAAAYAVGDVLARARDLPTAAPAILRAMCANLEWHVGALWLLDPSDRRLHCAALWSEEGISASAFEKATRNAAFPSTVGLPGRVLATGKPAWIENVVQDANFPRSEAAREAGLHGAFAFPICLGEEVVGVIECFNRIVVPVEPDLLRTMATVGNQIGQFIARKREEEAVSDEQRRTSAIVNTALDAVIGMSHTGVITEFNPAAERIFGYSREAALGRELAELLIPPALRQKHREGLVRYLATGQGAFIDRRVETVAYQADGREFPVEVAITKTSEDDPPLFTGFVRDLSARVRAEREREQLLSREARARSEAEAANRAKDEFLATLSHELRTPLNAIVGWTRMLLDGTLDPRSTRRALEVIDRNAQLQAQLVADILDVSRIITGGLRLDPRPVDLGSVIGAALDAVRPAAEAKNVRLSSRFTGSARLVLGDPQRLQQVVWNLLSNAVKFTATAGTVTIELVDASADRVHIRVSDNGAGIDPAFLPHVFERFRQGDGSANRQHGGLGLGLAIVRHLVELHGGTVHAESAGTGQGSTFTVVLPSLTAHPGTSVQQSEPEGTDGAAERSLRRALQGYRLLVVDDQEDTRDLMATILSGLGAHVDTAASVADALEKVKLARPHALLADLGMPGADGYALIREVRRWDAQSGAHLPAAAITAYVSEGDRAKALAAGFDCHVPKPVSQPAIVSAVLSICPDVSPAS